MRIHLIYPCGEAISCPQAIGRHLLDALKRVAPVCVHPLDATYTIFPEPGDILIGHPGWEPWHVFNRSVRQPGWARRIGIQPFCPGDPRLQAATDRVIGFCDRFLAICGKWWFDRTPDTLFRHWQPKLIHLDLAVDRQDFPCIKHEFAPAGKRRYLYIGHSAWYKQPEYLCALAKARPGQIGWIGKMRRRFRGPERLGQHDFTNPASRDLVAQYDFLLCVGSADANPTTILEAMSWGLIPVCTRESGYSGHPGIVNLPVDDLAGALAVLDDLQTRPAAELLRMQADNHRELTEHFHWPRLCAQVVEVVTASDSPGLLPRDRVDCLAMRLWELRSPNCWLRPRTLRHRFQRYVRNRCLGITEEENRPVTMPAQATSPAVDVPVPGTQPRR